MLRPFGFLWSVAIFCTALLAAFTAAAHHQLAHRFGVFPRRHIVP